MPTLLPPNSQASYKVWRIYLPDGPDDALVAESAQQFGDRTRWLVAWVKYINQAWPVNRKTHGITELWSGPIPYQAEDITQATLLDPLISAAWATHAPGWLWRTVMLHPHLSISPEIFKTWCLSPDPHWRLHAIQLAPRVALLPHV